MAKKQNKLQLIPLGGVAEIGKNMSVLRFGQEIMIIDAGLKFPGDDMPGIDYIIPNFSYLIEHKDLIKGMCLTHGHEDHIGAVAYLLKEIQVPIYGSGLTLGLLGNKLKEHKVNAETHTIKNGDIIQLGRSFKIEFIQNNHSIPDSFSLAIRTPSGILIHTGDFKIDQTPVSGPTFNLKKLAAYGQEGVLALMIDSTNAEREGYTKSERIVGKTFEEMLRTHTESRIFVATFASNLHRIQQVFDVAEKFGRKVSAVGRSMINNIEIAARLGYLKFIDKNYIPIENINSYKDSELLIISTGSQGEPLAGLTRMAAQSHQKVNIRQGDLVIMSSSPIPGNERLVNRVIDGLYRCGATVIHQGMADVHVSGHGSREEIKMILNLVQPKNLIPFHGEYRHQASMIRLAEEMGFPRDCSYSAELGDVIEISDDGLRKVGSVNAGPIYVDGIGIGDVGSAVLRDRLQLSMDGTLTVVMAMDSTHKNILTGPEVLTRGFIYVKESEELIRDIRQLTKGIIAEQIQMGNTNLSLMANTLKDALSGYLFEKTERTPVILPIIMEVY
jgi:ribonuclease J